MRGLLLVKNFLMPNLEKMLYLASLYYPRKLWGRGGYDENASDNNVFLIPTVEEKTLPCKSLLPEEKFK